MISITPKVFVNNWGLIKEGYLRLPDQFIITTESQSGDTNTIAITESKEIAAAIKTFEDRAAQIQGFTQPKSSANQCSIPPEIDQWLTTAKSLTSGKQIPCRGKS